MQALDRARAYLAQGDSVLIYPEGKLNHGVGMLRGKVGAARLAFDSRAPLLPIGVYVPPRWSREIHGHFYGRPTIGYWQMGGTCHIARGEPRPPLRGGRPSVIGKGAEPATSPSASPGSPSPRTRSRSTLTNCVWSPTR